ncbi:hypothetical protein BD413DRAFT_640329 [Trametes elegans]|nr:hypothetical protein BD413DRAFT_640329 [Trametes elegans]
MQLDFALRRKLGKGTVKWISLAGSLLALVLLFVVAWGGAYPSYDPNPPVIFPREGETWRVGEMHTVQWKVDGIPTTNSSGLPILAVLVLAYWSDTNEPALLRHQPLTDWVPITDSMANVIVPSVPTRSDYSIYLNAHDDRSSRSGIITIFNPDDPRGTGAPPRTLVITNAPPIASTVLFPSPTPLPQSLFANVSPTSSVATTASSATATTAPDAGATPASDATATATTTTDVALTEAPGDPASESSTAAVASDETSTVSSAVAAPTDSGTESVSGAADTPPTPSCESTLVSQSTAPSPLLSTKPPQEVPTSSSAPAARMARAHHRLIRSRRAHPFAPLSYHS